MTSSTTHQRWYPTSADELPAGLRAGHDLPVIDTWLLLDDAEQAHAQGDATIWWHGALDVPYEQRQFMAFGGLGLFALTAGISAVSNHRRRASSRRLAAPQWRNLGHAPVTVTSHRTVIALEGDWFSLWHEDLLHLAPDPTAQRVQMTLDNGTSYALTGPWVPYLSSILSHLVRGGRPS